MQLNWRFKSLRESCNLTALNVLERPNRMMSRRQLLQNGTCRHFDANLHECLGVATLEDEAGLLFEEWQPQQDVDASIPEEPMIINSSELRAAGFKMTEVIPPALEQAARRGGAGRRKGAGLRRVGGLPQRFTLSVADDNKFRALCE